MASFAPTNQKFVKWEDHSRMEKLIQEGWTILNHGHDGVTLARPTNQNVPMIFGGNSKGRIHV